MRTLLAAATACAALAIPATASAKDFCVGGPAGCSGTPVAAGGLKAALTAAQGNGSDDRFFLAPGIYAADAFSHQSPERVQIIGAGAGKTIMSGSIDDDWVLTLAGNPDSSVSGVTLAPTAAPRGALMMLNGADAHGVTIDAKSAGAHFSYGAVLYGGSGTFDNGRIDLATANHAYAIAAIDSGTVSDSTVIAHAAYGAVIAAGGEVAVRRSTLEAPVGAIADGGHLTISDSLIDLRGLGAGAGVAAMPGAFGIGKISSVDIDRSTIVGSGGKFGVAADAEETGESATAHVRDTVISGFDAPVARVAGVGTIGATLTTDRSVYPAPVAPIDVGTGHLIETRHVAVSPGFVGNGDFHLAAGSALIDAGSPGSVPAGTVDRDGRPRASDGNGDCARINDIGAFEYQGTKTKAIAHAAKATAVAGTPVAFTAAGSCIPGPGTPTIGWRFDDGAQATGAAVAHAFATPGRHTATVTVTDGHGHTAQASTAITVTAAPVVVAPRISRLRVTPKPVHVGKRASIRFRLTAPATVTVRIAKVGHGKRRTLTLTAHQGANKLRLRKSSLKPGRYRLTAVATTTTGQRSNRARIRFTVR
jgi:hypothetical protein